MTVYDFGILLIAALILFAVSVLQERGMKIREKLFALPLPIRWALLYAFILFTLATFVGTGTDTGSFMYAVF